MILQVLSGIRRIPVISLLLVPDVVNELPVMSQFLIYVIRNYMYMNMTYQYKVVHQ